MWPNSDLALALHRARRVEAFREPRGRRPRRQVLPRAAAALRPVPASWAR